jgi:hypothetical protein
MMKKGFFIGILVVGILCCFVLPAFGSWITWFSARDNPVEQQTSGGATQPDQSLWIINPASYIWDADDRVKLIGDSTLYSQSEAIYAESIIADNCGHLVGIDVNASTSDLTVQIQMSGMGLDTTNEVIETYRDLVIEAFPVKVDKRSFRYVACAYGSKFDKNFINYLPIIENSNGGRGFIWEVRFIIRNGTNKTIRHISAQAVISPLYSFAQDQFCPTGFNDKYGDMYMQPIIWISK